MVQERHQTENQVWARVLKALANEKRLIILYALTEGEKNVSQLQKIASISQSALSQHLAKLREENIVKTRRDAQTIYYSMLCPLSQKLLECLKAKE